MKDILGYQNKRVVVSGCFSGMGEATARTLLDIGAEVHGLDYKDSALPLASFTRVDLRDPASIEAVATQDWRQGRCAVQLRRAAADRAAARRHEVLIRHRPGGALLPFRPKAAPRQQFPTGGLGWRRRIPTTMQRADASSKPA